MSETLLAVIITAVLAPLSLEILRYVFGVLGKTKQKEIDKLVAQEQHIKNLEKRIDDIRDQHTREMVGLRESLNKDIEALRNENVKLQILVAENAVKLTIKDEIIARLTSTRKPKTSQQ